jgi:uncharacterized membrane protein YccC
MTSVEAKTNYTASSSFPHLSTKTSRKWQWPLQEVFGDLRVRSGIKFGLAALLALYVAEVLRLQHPNWSILTVLGMMSVPYVGSITILAITQVAGTIAGALVGIWLVGDYASTPVIFLTLFFFVLAFSAYKFGRAQASPVSLGYYLVGFTTIAVTTYGLADPGQVWQAGISRVLEILDGALSSLLVTTLLWPRSGREEFEAAGRDALNAISNLFSVHLNVYLQRQKAPADVEQMHRAFGERLTVLRNLVQVGSKESAVFQTWLSDHGAFLASITRLFCLVLDLSRKELETPILKSLESELEAVADAISKEFDILTRSRRTNEKLGSSGLPEAFAAFEKKVSELREKDGFSSTRFQNGFPFSRGFVVLRSLRDELNNIRAQTQSMPAPGQPAPEPKLTSGLLPTIDWDWVKIGVKSSSAAVISILLLMWINPPGASIIPLVAWLLTILRRPFLRAGGMGDLRGFQNSVLAALGLAACVVLLILVTPLLADYPAMNVALFLMMFVVGFTTARSAGISFWTQIGMLIIYTIIGLNPQQPVPTPTIIDTFVGFITGMTIATVVGRVFWPVLPQMVMRDNLLAIFGDIKALLNGGPRHENIQKQLAVLPVEALQASRQIRIAGCTPQEKARLGALIQALQTLSTRTLVLVSRRHTLPAIAQAVIRPRFERLEVEFKQVLDAFADCLRQGDCRHALPTLNGAFSEMEEAAQHIRKSDMLKRYCLEASFVRVLELVDHYHATAEALEACNRLIGTLKIHRYWGHCGL